MGFPTPMGTTKEEGGGGGRGGGRREGGGEEGGGEMGDDIGDDFLGEIVLGEGRRRGRGRGKREGEEKGNSGENDFCFGSYDAFLCDLFCSFFVFTEIFFVILWVIFFGETEALEILGPVSRVLAKIKKK